MVRTDVGTADKSKVRKIAWALGRSDKALDMHEIAAMATIHPPDVAESLQEMALHGMISESGPFFALNSELELVEIWAEATGAAAFTNRISLAPAHEHWWPALPSKSLSVLTDLRNARKISDDDEVRLRRSILFKLSKLAYEVDPGATYSIPGAQRRRGEVPLKVKARAILFLLAARRAALDLGQLEDSVSWPLHVTELRLLQRQGLLITKGFAERDDHTVSRRRRAQFAISPAVGGAGFFAESVGDQAFDRLELGSSAVRPRLDQLTEVRKLTIEGRLAEPDSRRLRSAFEQDRAEVQRRSRPTVTRPSRKSPRSAPAAPVTPKVSRARRDKGESGTRSDRLYRLLCSISRLLLIPPPPRRVVLNIFGDDLRDAELELDRVLMKVGPPPGWQPQRPDESRA